MQRCDLRTLPRSYPVWMRTAMEHLWPVWQQEMRMWRTGSREQRRGLLQILKRFPVVIAGPCPVTDAIVTSGGVKVKEINPASMASKLVDGLYFAGEIIDVDAYTGGFNLQIAWSTGRAAGVAAAEEA